jgi:glutathione S-transferase
MRLLGRSSSINVRKVLWTAREIGLDFKHEDDWATAARPSSTPEFLTLNPSGLVPVWQDGNGTLWESNAICRYLASCHGRADLLPLDPFRRALVERWMDWAAGDLNRAWSYAFMALVRRDRAYADETEVVRSAAAWNRLMGILDAHLGEGGPYVGGADFTLGDVPVGLAAHRWRSTPLDRPRLKHVAAYLDLLGRRPLFAALTTEELP